ncbi:glucosidase 2 subunit beta-like, partial [Chamaea fasciata]|uniref:glucosidase 2 subunit beta-like n=1 Tax=Chamaea fasciata TaxID=190680 RepID=UPI00336A501D
MGSTGSSALGRFRFRSGWPEARARDPDRPAMPPLPLLALLPLVLGGTPEVTVTRPRGVALSQLPFYDPSGPFRCLDGSGSVDFSWVNDDYCDCRDGSDEPGTPACPNGRFHCTNAGHRPRSIPAAHVNDGVCDCCDGTDEWGSGAGCENTCRERGRREREARLRSAALAREGFALRQRLVQEAAEGKREKQARLEGLQEARAGSWSSAWGRSGRPRRRPRDPSRRPGGSTGGNGG